VGGQLFVRHGSQVFRDEVVWDVGQPVNTPEAYAECVCADLGLGCDWFDAICGHVKDQLHEMRVVRRVIGCVCVRACVCGAKGGRAWTFFQQHQHAFGVPIFQGSHTPRHCCPLQDLKEAPRHVKLQQPVAEGAIFKQQPPPGSSSSQLGVPRLEPYDAANDAEAARLAARKAAGRPTAAEIAAAAEKMQQAKQQQQQMQMQQQMQQGAQQQQQQQLQQQPTAPR
jgi:hypothetical protein